MVKVLEITNLSYKDFSNINLVFEEGMLYSIVGPNGSGKSTLFKLISGIIPTQDFICLNHINLNIKSASKYVINLGIVDRVNTNSFAYRTVIDEMLYPLRNLGYSKSKALERINEVLELFSCNNMIDKRISELSFYEKELLLIMISLLHKPKVLLLDSVLQVFSRNKQDEIIKILKKLIQDGLTVINFTNYLQDASYSDRIIVLDKYVITGEYTYSDIFSNDKVFYDCGLEIPFMTDLSIKLKMYNLIDKEYSNMKEMVDDLWP